jgi:hypothetical protein
LWENGSGEVRVRNKLVVRSVVVVVVTVVVQSWSVVFPPTRFDRRFLRVKTRLGDSGGH